MMVEYNKCVYYITTGRYVVKTHQGVTKEVTTPLNLGMPEIGGQGAPPPRFWEID